MMVGLMADRMEDVFGTYLNSMKEMVESKNYDSCISRTLDITTVSLHFDYETGLLISEVLEDVFGQVNNAIQERIIDFTIQTSVNDELSQHLDSILKSYRKNDKNDLFNALVKIRSAATRFFYYSFDCPKISETPKGL